ncbi:LEAF RUST 10 DISEASE-RESISTANCE LOCUS RECEPTOR-LIKE PROTEIN KINASE-like 1.1 isoform X2 [Jatropha curcas]|uniref:LEAF RUST 10 DISEASE-RESISTANCE LOCUS RECEPTOR-LIKE PROTEIN KINASE-like 1.1 isoform X2 n=1 Tax=Jatropha curcas TaxID=180498 RepID=UPI0005FBE33D|nr:LEAF RUST 10 DISEASE-RESISTANCE LOCUS RECEPTOR-LIKE PROTEIN KINASE-like 1.1 isoform X2 [Jatropha curcas]
MARLFVLVLFFVCHLALHSAEEEEMKHRPDCPPFFCGKLGEIKFPFSKTTGPPNCGLLKINGCDSYIQNIQLENGGKWFEVTDISQAGDISIHDQALADLLHSHNCETFKNLSLPRFPFVSFEIKNNLSLFKCEQKLGHPYQLEYTTGCNNSHIYYPRQNQTLPSVPPQCSLIQLPGNQNGNRSNIFTLLTANFFLQVHVHKTCQRCYARGEVCKTNREEHFYCAKVKEGNNKLGLKLGLGLGIGVPVIISFLFIFWVYRRRRQASSNLLSTNSTSDPSSKSDVELGGIYLGVPLFSYNELEEATCNFDGKKELGDGGFGTVYYGKLRDGREVAVKRLYEHNYRRVEQFMNEIEILTRLRHKNLVSLYGCTSHRSRELLLVYEYIPNGTVADHLHGDRAKSSPLTWPVRLSIAIETATALSYLHASDIIHRDVKTNNILLDNNFCVKVADFGLSRLFPNDVTHVSTAPQGTPGYVDPEYHQCYQLTDKSDVYSFGVVLIELISSMPAVDISRHRHEINLANLAVTKIQKCAFDELIDASFGYNSEEKVKRMTISVAELAFRCLQLDKEMRPTMDEVLEELRRIQSIGEEVKDDDDDDDQALRNTLLLSSPPDSGDESLLKNIRLPPSPDTVTAKWPSCNSNTPSVSG